jgi:hypothetical protein
VTDLVSRSIKHSKSFKEKVVIYGNWSVNNHALKVFLQSLAKYGLWMMADKWKKLEPTDSNT